MRSQPHADQQFASTKRLRILMPFFASGGFRGPSGPTPSAGARTLGVVSDLLHAHPLNVPARWFAKEASVIAAEMGRALITHSQRCAGCVCALVKHQLP